MSVLGERVSRLTTRLGVFTFGVSVALFEAEYLRWMIRMRQKGRALLGVRLSSNRVRVGHNIDTAATQRVRSASGYMHQSRSYSYIRVTVTI